MIAHTFNENSMHVSSSCTLREIMFNDNRFQTHAPQPYENKNHLIIQMHDLASTFDDYLKCGRFFDVFGNVVLTAEVTASVNMAHTIN